MTSKDSFKLKVAENVVTFESRRPIPGKGGLEIPAIDVGYNGRLCAVLFQYVNPEPSSEGIEYQQWFALPAHCPADVHAAILAIAPAGQSLEELKAVVSRILKESVPQSGGG